MARKFLWPKISCDFNMFRNIEDILRENKDAVKRELDDASVEILTRNLLEQHQDKNEEET